MASKALTVEDVITLMRRKQGKRTQLEFSRALGISATLLCEIYSGRRDPGESVLEALGLEKQVRYFRKSVESVRQSL